MLHNLSLLETQELQILFVKIASQWMEYQNKIEMPKQLKEKFYDLETVLEELNSRQPSASSNRNLSGSEEK